MKLPKGVRIKKTPNCRHLYTATMRGVGTYGFGQSRALALASLWTQMAAIERQDAKRHAEKAIRP